MKRLKQLLVIGLAIVSVLAFTACDSCSSCSSDDTATLTAISVDYSAAKTEYSFGESFSYEGLVVTATYDDESTATIASESYTVDSSAFNSSVGGTYSIVVSYTEGEVTQTASYSVTVNEYSYGGLYITKTTTDYTVESSSGVTVSTDDLAVYLVDPDLNVSTTALSSSEYTLKYYKEGTEISSLANLTEGKYQIWAYYNNPYSASPAQLSNFVFINVLDEIKSIELSNVETGTFTQNTGNTDLMSSTWTYTLTYSSGATKPLTADDVTVTGITTTLATDAGVATVTYSTVNASGVTETVTCEVSYTVTLDENASSESFIVANTSDGATASSTTYAANETITSNSLFSVTAGVNMIYSVGKEYGSISTGGNALTFTDMDGNTVAPDQGISMESAFSANETINNILTVTATKDITIYVYVVFTNTSFNSNKKGTVFCSIDGTTYGSEELSKRTTLWSYGKAGITLKAGQTLVIGATDSNGDKANFWFFGAEAVSN